ncbi:MAG: energy-coupling factor ABC transporter ATP-binding protein [Treponema sp.]|nr:energy-coupling factor ABC transporter ATP-binding protein [Treponema sp.]
MSIVDFNDVSFIYPRSRKKALDGVTISIEKGEFLAVMGEAGSGKSAFCKLINGVIPLLSGGRLSGTVISDGIRADKSTVPQMAIKVGLVMDDPDAQLFTSSAREEAAFGPENLLLPPEEIEKRIEYALNAVGLKGFDDRNPASLSGGEKQRLVIAAALAMKCGILVLDEPLCRLDPKGAVDVMNVLKDIQKNSRITVIMSSHNSGLMAKYADRVCILKNGKIAALDSAEIIFSNAELLESNGIQSPEIVNEFFLTESAENAESGGEKSIEPNSLLASCAIKISNLNFKYPTGTGISNLNLSINEGDFAALIGDNGCGKTTLLKCITGLLKPHEGEIFIKNKNANILSVSDISKDVGYVMQNPDNQLFTDSVFKEIAFALKNMRLSKPEIKQRAQEALDIVGLQDADAFPHALSRADRTKTVIACVLAMGCKILVLDEIDVGNDYKGNLKIMDVLNSLNARGFTIIFVTHNMFLAHKYARRLIKLDRNGIVYDMRREV